jgi:hypothetical protein
MTPPAGAVDRFSHIVMTLVLLAQSVRILLRRTVVGPDMLQLMYASDIFLHCTLMSNLVQVQPQCMGCGVYYPALKGHCGRCKGRMGASAGLSSIFDIYELKCTHSPEQTMDLTRLLLQNVLTNIRPMPRDIG